MQALASRFSVLVVLTALIIAVGESAGIAAPPKPKKTSCPVQLKAIDFRAEVSKANRRRLRNAVVTSTAIPVGRRGTCSRVVGLRRAVASKAISRRQLRAYRRRVGRLLKLGDRVFSLRWRRRNGTTLSTLGVATRRDAWKFEPISSWDPGSLRERPRATARTAATIRTLTSRVSQNTKLGTTGYSATKKVIIITDDDRTITDQSETISFITGFGWEAAATKDEAKKILLNSGGEYPLPIECKKVTITITFVTGFKRLKVAGGGGGFKGSIDVEGRLGINGQHQEVLIMCADGQAFLDGEAVP